MITTLNKIETLQDLQNERARLEQLKLQNELLIQADLSDLKAHLKPVTDLIGAFSKDGNKSTMGKVVQGAKTVIPVVAGTLLGGPKVGAVSIAASLIGKLFSRKNKRQDKK